MKKHYYVLLLAAALCLAGCGKTPEPTPQVEQQQPEAEVAQEKQEELNEDVEETTEESTFSYADLEKINFDFSSGAGGWGTYLYLNPDGSFRAEYHDSDMGDIADEYPNGTVYACVVEGQLGELEQVNEHTYKTEIMGMKYEFNTGEEEILDGVRYVYTEPYGLEDGRDFYFYLPGTPVADINQETISWAMMNCSLEYDPDTEQPKEQELPFYMFENANKHYGFVGYEIKQ